jgi:hypothetical protein
MYNVSYDWIAKISGLLRTAGAASLIQRAIKWSGKM